MDPGELTAAAGEAIGLAGVAVIVVGLFVATASVLRRLAGGAAVAEAYRDYRHGLGSAILLGLEFLVAADIIRTVAVAPTFQNVGILALIIAIRTFLSMALQLEITGRWPWQQSERPAGAASSQQRADGEP